MGQLSVLIIPGFRQLVHCRKCVEIFDEAVDEGGQVG